MSASAALFSPAWHRVAGLRPRLPPHARILRQSYADGVWFLLQDDASGRFHRFTPEAWEVIGRLDGRATVQEVWEAASARLGDAMPTQNQVVALLGQLQQADLLRAGASRGAASADFRRQADRARRERGRRARQRLMTPLSIYVPLLDPDRFLQRTEWLVRWMFTPAGFALWLLALGAGAVGAAIHAKALFGSLEDQVFTLQNLALMAALFPAAKVLHELGHAYAVKRWGGEVHEMGVMLMVLYPVPYLDASAAAGFGSRLRRAAVGAAGMMVELLVASAAVWVWILAEPGPLRAAAANLVVLAGLSAVVFNGNPLLRLDAYYILSDLTGVPNLAQRGNAQLGHWIARAAGARDLTPPASSRKEAAFLGAYAVLSFAYRLLVVGVVVALVASQSLLVGTVVGAWAFAIAFLWPALKMLAKPHTDPRLRPVRWRLHLAWVAAAAALAALLLRLPAPFATRAQGVVWPAEEAMVRAQTPGFVREVLAPSGSPVRPGQPVLRLEDSELDQRVASLEAGLLRAEREYQASLADRGQAVALLETLAFLRGQLERARQQQAELTLRAATGGTLLLADPERMLGVFLARGERVGFVSDPERLVVQALVREDDIAAVRDRLRRVEIRLAARPGEAVEARVLRVVPAATQELPSPVLTVAGGGPFAPDPAAAPPRQGGAGAPPSAFERLVRLDLAAPGLERHRVEERAHVLFLHDPEPLGFRWWRWLRRAFQRQFGV